MYKSVICVFAVIVITGCQPDKTNQIVTRKLTSYVDPFIGTGGHGHTYPGATVPFGMVQLSPDNGTTGWDWCSGYHYSDSIVVGFGHTHLSGTGIGDMADILLMPTTGACDISKDLESHRDHDFASKYDHKDESASPGYYAVKLQDTGIDVELTASERAGFHRYTFPKGEDATVILNLDYSVNWDKVTQSNITVVNDTLLTGYRMSTGWAKDQRMFFAIQFSKPLVEYEMVNDGQYLEGSNQTGTGLIGKFRFGKSMDGDVVLAKVGLSSASVDGAQKSLSEISHWNFDQVKEHAATQWERELGKIVMESSDAGLMKTFYTALYHSFLAPVTFSDLNGQYKGADSAFHTAEGYKKYAIFSLWDTFRAENPLLTIVQPEKINDLIVSMMSHYREHGLLPVWELVGNETNTMTGYHAVPVIVDAYFKGFRDYDIEEMYQAIKTSGMQEIRGVNYFKTHGYIPADLENESVTKNLEYAFDDWCIAQVAKDLGKTNDYEYFMKRSESYKLLFDQETGFMRGKLVDGSWKEPFDPKYSVHRVGAEYTEGNAWQHSWFVPHDVEGLIALHGGDQAFVAKLDQLFSETSEITGENVSADITGLIGQYAHGNEPSHHIAYLYNYAGAAHRTQQMVREIMNTQYSTNPDGLSGNEDCGQMSAWYIFSALGMYPVNPASGEYQLGSPIIDRASITLGNGQDFTIEVINQSADNIYIKKVLLNGEAVDNMMITHEQLLKGGTMTFEMTDQPSVNQAN